MRTWALVDQCEKATKGQIQTKRIQWNAQLQLPAFLLSWSEGGCLEAEIHTPIFLSTYYPVELGNDSRFVLVLILTFVLLRSV